MLLQEQPLFRVLCISSDKKAYFTYVPKERYLALLAKSKEYSLMIWTDYQDHSPHADRNADNQLQLILPLDDRNVVLAMNDNSEFVGVYAYVDPKLLGSDAPATEGFIDVAGHYCVCEMTIAEVPNCSARYVVRACLVKDGKPIALNGHSLKVAE